MGISGREVDIRNLDRIQKMFEQTMKEKELKLKDFERKIYSLHEKAKFLLKEGNKTDAELIIEEKKYYSDKKIYIEEMIDLLKDQRNIWSNSNKNEIIKNIIEETNKKIKEFDTNLKNNKELSAESISKKNSEIKETQSKIRVLEEELWSKTKSDDILGSKQILKKMEEFSKQINNYEEEKRQLIKEEKDESSNEINKLKEINNIIKLANQQIKDLTEEKKIDRKKEKKEIIDKQSNFRLIKNKESNKKEETKEVLEDMCIMGSIMKEEILEEKKNNPEKFIPTETALKETNNEKIFCLGVLAQNLENLGIVTAIEKNPSINDESQNASNTVLQFLTNGLMNKKKYNFHFDLGETKNYELLNNKDEQKKFNDKLRKKLSIEYNIPESKIIITNPQKGSYEIQVIFETEEFNNTDLLDMEKFKDKCKNDDQFKELCNLKEIQQTTIMEGCKLDANMLDPEGNRESGWEEGGKRGGLDYIPPKGWKGFGLKVKDKYDGGNNDWLGCDGNPNEWAVAYHGIGTNLGMSLERATHNIIRGGFKKGGRQFYEFDDDENHPGQKVGKGVYCSPNPDVMDSYAQSTEKNEKIYKMGFMIRVKPDKIRCPKCMKDYWVLDGTTEQMRPYRILIKEN